MWSLGRTDGIHRNDCAGYLTLHNDTLSCELVELGFVSLQGVDLAATDESIVRAPLDAFPRALSSCRVFHHVMCAAHSVAHRSSNSLRRLGEQACSAKGECGDGCNEFDLHSAISLRQRLNN